MELHLDEQQLSRLALQVDDADHALQRAGAHTAPDLQHAFGPTGAGRTANAAYAQARSRLTEAAGQLARQAADHADALRRAARDTADAENAADSAAGGWRRQ
ncbi:hypothetical protein [Angustibacter aerolatus]